MYDGYHARNCAYQLSRIVASAMSVWLFGVAYAVMVERGLGEGRNCLLIIRR